MKKLFVVFLSLVVIALAQSEETSAKAADKSISDLHLSSVDISSGKGAISSGLFLYFNLENEKGMLQTTLSQDDIEVAYFYRLFEDKVLIGPDAGFFCNVPFAGPEIITAPTRWISTLHWYGWSLGEPNGKVEFNNPGFLFAVDAVNIKVWQFSLGYCLINYMDHKPQHTTSLKFTQKVDSKFSLYVDTGYDFLNESQLLKIGISWGQ